MSNFYKNIPWLGLSLVICLLAPGIIVFLFTGTTGIIIGSIIGSIIGIIIQFIMEFILY